MNKININETYRISVAFDDKYRVKGWYTAIHKENQRWKLTRKHISRKGALLQALDMIREDIENENN